MNIFKSFTLKWWQGALYKWGVLALGIAVGTYWHVLFDGLIAYLLIVAALSLSYITLIWLKQIRAD